LRKSSKKFDPDPETTKNEDPDPGTPKMQIQGGSRSKTLLRIEHEEKI
jgi:hypothetical protein